MCTALEQFLYIAMSFVKLWAARLAGLDVHLSAAVGQGFMQAATPTTKSMNQRARHDFLAVRGILDRDVQSTAEFLKVRYLLDGEARRAKHIILWQQLSNRHPELNGIFKALSSEEALIADPGRGLTLSSPQGNCLPWPDQALIASTLHSRPAWRAPPV